MPQWLQSGLEASISDFEKRSKIIWAELGETEDSAETQRKATLLSVSHHLEQQLRTQEDRLSDIAEKCRSGLVSLRSKCAKVPDHSLEDPVEKVSAPWLRCYHDLESNHAQIDTIIEGRSQRLNKVIDRITQITAWLDEPSIECQQVLTLENIYKLEQAVKPLESQLELRCQQTLTLGSKIEEALSSLGLDKDSLTEEQVLFVHHYKASPERFVGPEFSTSIGSFCESLRELILTRISSLNNIKAECQELWTVLQVPEGIQELFAAEWDGITEGDIKAWQQECVNRQAERRSALLEKAADLTVKSKSIEAALSLDPSDLQRIGGACKTINENCTDEELMNHVATLEAQNRELEALHSARNMIDKMLDRLRELYKQEIELKEIEGNPNRLKTRGNQALRETALRLRVRDKLPRLEKELRTEVDLYEKKYNLPVKFEHGSLREWLEQRESDRTALRRQYGVRLPPRQAGVANAQPAGRSKSMAISSVSEGKLAARSVSADLGRSTKSQAAINATATHLIGRPKTTAENTTAGKARTRVLAAGHSIRKAIGTFHSDRIEAMFSQKKPQEEKEKEKVRPPLQSIHLNNAETTNSSEKASSFTSDNPIPTAPSRRALTQKENSSVYRKKLCAVLAKAQRRQLSPEPIVTPAECEIKVEQPLAEINISSTPPVSDHNNGPEGKQESKFLSEDSIPQFLNVPVPPEPDLLVRYQKRECSSLEPVDLIWPLENYFAQLPEGGGDLSFDPKMDAWRRKKLAERNEKYKAKQNEIDAAYQRINLARQKEAELKEARP